MARHTHASALPDEDLVGRGWSHAPPARTGHGPDRAAGDGRQAIVPRIVTDDPEGLLGFMRSLLGCTGELADGRPTEARLGTSTVLVSDSGGAHPPTPAFLLVYVADVEAVYDRAMQAGAASVSAPEHQPWGGRRAVVTDAWGNRWDIAAAPS